MTSAIAARCWAYQVAHYPDIKAHAKMLAEGFINVIWC